MRNNGIQKLFLSIIIPCKNEEANITRCIKSIIENVRTVEDAEILLVDCASNDASIELAKQFPINIIQLKPHWAHSPAAARYLGCLNTSGKYIFIIDADMELLSGFLEKAIKFMEKDEKIAGVAGMGSEAYKEGGKLDDLYERKNKLREVSFLGGAALYRMAVLHKVGNFNPYLQAEEESELAQRLQRAGFKLFSLPYPMTMHYSSKSMENFLNRLKAGFFLGIGQMLRLSLTKGTFCFNLLRFKLLLMFIGVIIILISSSIYIFLSKNYFLFTLEMIAVLLFWLSACLAKRGFKNGSLSIFKWLAINTSIIAGFMKKTKDSNTYPRDVVVIKKGIRVDHK